MTITRKGRKIDLRRFFGNIIASVCFIIVAMMIFNKVFAFPLHTNNHFEKKLVFFENQIKEQKLIQKRIMVYGQTESSAIELSNKIISTAKTTGVDPLLLSALIETESGFDQSKISEAGACGLGQLTDVCVEELSRKGIHVNLSNADENLLGSAQYLKMMLERFDEDETLAIAAYNAGPTIVETVGIPDFDETRIHVQRVLERKNSLSR